jgi:hypothetical protein
MSFALLNFEFIIQEMSMNCASVAMTAAFIAGALGLAGGLSNAKADDLSYFTP